MSPDPTLQSHLRAQFQLAFGAPHRTMGHDDHWQLHCLGSSNINILVNGSPERPAVWVFAAHDQSNGVFSRTIANKDDVADVIEHIQARLKLPDCGASWMTSEPVEVTA